MAVSQIPHAIQSLRAALSRLPLLVPPRLEAEEMYLGYLLEETPLPEWMERPLHALAQMEAGQMRREPLVRIREAMPGRPERLLRLQELGENGSEVMWAEQRLLPVLALA